MPDDGGVAYTVKELLGRQDEKLDKILDKLDQKVDRSDFIAVADRVTSLELHGSQQAIEAVRQLTDLEKRLDGIERTQLERGPLVNEFAKTQDRVERHGDRLTKLEDGISTQIAAAIKENQKLIQAQRDRFWSTGKGVVVIVCAIIGALGTVVSTLVLLHQLSHL
jgi:hypothetical protein